VVVDFIGYPPPARQLGNLHFTTSLSEAAALAVQLVNGNGEMETSQSPGTNHYLRGLFSGGTLAYEAMLVLQATLYPLYSNAPITTHQLLSDPLHSQAHTILDLGGDEFTVGRLHPMMDNDLRIRRLKQEAADPEVGLILLDVVLGEGAHADPASELAPAIADVRREGLEIAAVVVGTDDDPQDMPGQVSRLREAGATVFTDPSQALSYVSGRFAALAGNDSPPVALAALTQPLAAINVGVESFHLSLEAQGARSVHVDWRPPAAGNEKLAAILAKMKKKA
jgi:FdrA protein